MRGGGRKESGQAKEKGEEGRACEDVRHCEVGKKTGWRPWAGKRPMLSIQPTGELKNHLTGLQPLGVGKAGVDAEVVVHNETGQPGTGCSPSPSEGSISKPAGGGEDL